MLDKFAACCCIPSIDEMPADLVAQMTHHRGESSGRFAVYRVITGVV